MYGDFKEKFETMPAENNYLVGVQMKISKTRLINCLSKDINAIV